MVLHLASLWNRGGSRVCSSLDSSFEFEFELDFELKFELDLELDFELNFYLFLAIRRSFWWSSGEYRRRST